MIEFQVEGKMALFTPPESRVERFSYMVPTPSAVRGIAESIYWKPQFKIRVRSISVLKDFNFLSLKQNELKSFPSHCIIEEQRTQRTNVYLYDVAYKIQLEFLLKDKTEDNNLTKHYAIFQRRLENGQCEYRPYFGIEDCPCSFHICDPEMKPIPLNMELPPMLFDWYKIGEEPIVRRFYKPRLENGTIKVPQNIYEEMGL